MQQFFVVVLAALLVFSTSSPGEAQIRHDRRSGTPDGPPGGGSMNASTGSSGGALVLLDYLTVDRGADDESRDVSIGPDGSLYATGYVTLAGHGRDIWLAKYDQGLVELDSATIDGGVGDDEGYAIAFDGDGSLYLVGYMTESGQDHNIWLGRFDADLDLVHHVTINGAQNDADDGYGILFDQVSDHLYVAGTVREPGEGANIWIGIFDTSLNLVEEIRLNGPADDTDKARFLVFDDQRRLFVSGSMTEDIARDYDIWIGKFEADLGFIDDLVIAGPTTDEDKGYGIVFQPPGTLFVTGTIIETDESYNIWMAKLDTDLNVLKDLTINGPVDGEDVAYMLAADENGYLYHSGVFTEAEGGANIWLARFDTDLELEAWTTEDGPVGGYDTGIGVTTGADHELFVSAVVSGTAGLDIWIGRYLVGLVFTDSFESGDTRQWTTTAP